jgi:hypothetical protein
VPAAFTVPIAAKENRVNVYSYTSAECGLREAPDECLKLAGDDVRVVTDPAKADVFVVPPPFHKLGLRNALRLPHLDGNERRHVLFSIGEAIHTVLGRPCIFIRCDATQYLMARERTTVPWPWPAEDLGAWEQLGLPFQWDVFFHGWARLPLTTAACNSCAAAGLNCNIRVDTQFWAHQPLTDDQRAERRANFLGGLAASRLSLCPRSGDTSVIRYRFYEAMSMGRVPVLIGDESVLPFADRIDYDKCALWLEEDKVENVGPALKEWLAAHTDEQILDMGRYGREMWHKYLARDRWPELWTLVVKERLGLK